MAIMSNDPGILAPGDHDTSTEPQPLAPQPSASTSPVPDPSPAVSPAACRRPTAPAPAAAPPLAAGGGRPPRDARLGDIELGFGRAQFFLFLDGLDPALTGVVRERLDFHEAVFPFILVPGLGTN